MIGALDGVCGNMLMSSPVAISRCHASILLMAASISAAFSVASHAIDVRSKLLMQTQVLCSMHFNDLCWLFWIMVSLEFMDAISPDVVMRLVRKILAHDFLLYAYAQRTP